jgi:predicted nucleic acid-binding protein
MIIEAVSAGVVSGRALPGSSARPDLVRQLHVYQEQIERIPLMGVHVLPLEFETLLRSADIRRRYGLLVSDSLVAAAACGAGIAHLASADADFRRVKELKLYRPGDLS